MIEKVMKYIEMGKRQFLLEGPAGTGKTFLTKQVAERLNANYLFLQAFPGMRFEELTVQLMPSETKPSGVEIVKGVLVRAVEQSHYGPVVLVLDEFDKTIVSADSYLLDFLQNGRVTFKEELLVADMDNLVVFLTSNGAREFSEPLLRRVVRIKFTHPSKDRVVQILQENGVPQDVAKMLAEIHQLTVKAGLRKPATVQELKEFWMAVEAGIEVEDAVREVIIKYEEDEAIVPHIVALWLGHSQPEHVVQTEPETDEQAEQVENGTPDETTIATYDQAINTYVNDPAFEQMSIVVGSRYKTDKKWRALFVPQVYHVVEVLNLLNQLQPTDDPNVKLLDGHVVEIIRTDEALAVATDSAYAAAKVLTRVPEMDALIAFEEEIDDEEIHAAIEHLIQAAELNVIVRTTQDIVAVRSERDEQKFVLRISKQRNKVRIELVTCNIVPYYYNRAISAVADFIESWF
ncbi:MAG: AAA family ATPase [Pyrobaculum sp.]